MSQLRAKSEGFETGSPFQRDPNDHHDELGDPRFTDPKTGHMFQSIQDLVIWELLQGNRQYVRWLNDHDVAEETVTTKLSMANLKQVPSPTLCLSASLIRHATDDLMSRWATSNKSRRSASAWVAARFALCVPKP